MIANGDELRDKVVVVTGSSGGIGRAVALAFGERGACVVFNGRSPKKLAKVFDYACARGIRGIAVLADVATTAGANRLISAAFKRFGRVDVLVNNAGSGGPSPRPFWTLDGNDLDATVAINVQAALACSRAYVKRLRRQPGPGRIINVSSIAASRGFQGLACYCATKFALRGLTECMALDLEGSNTVVVSLELAGHRTSMTRRLLSHDEYASLLAPEDAVDIFLYAATGPAELLHGRTLSETRYRTDAEAEVQLNSSLASTAPWLPYMARYSSQPMSRDALHMDFLENSIGPPATARDALRRSTCAAMARYPDPNLRALRSKLAERTGIPADCFTFGNGSTEIIDRVLRTFVRPGETVVATDPTWPVFERMCRLHGIGIISVPYNLDLASGCARLDLNDILRLTLELGWFTW
jgi:3-oxoacyl-[acyl-carrier protein] reductase